MNRRGNRYAKGESYEKTNDSMAALCLYDIYSGTGNAACRCSGERSADTGRKQPE